MLADNKLALNAGWDLEMLRLGGALCTFALDSHPRDLPLYDHNNLSECFERLDRHIRELASSRRLPGSDEIRVPGTGRAARRSEREKNGVPLPATLLAQVDEVAKSLNVTPLSARA